MPGEEERPPGDAVTEVARLDVVATRLETLGAALQRSIGDTTESTVTLSRTVGTVSADLGRLIGEAVEALGKTRKVMLATDDAVGGVAVAFEQIEARLAEIATELGATVERQRRLEEDRPEPEVLGAAIGAEVANALGSFAERFTGQLDALIGELRDERAVLARRVRELTEPEGPPLTADAVRAEVEAALRPWINDLRDEMDRLATEVHDDRAVLSRRLAGQQELEELRELVETLAVRSDIVELREFVDGLAARADVEEVADELQSRFEAVVDTALAAHQPDERPVERLRTDVLALADDMATMAKRASASQRGVEELRTRIEKELPAALERAVAASTSEVRTDAESLIAELHDDLALVMRQVLAGNQELESLRDAITELTASHTEAAASTAGSGEDPTAVLGPVVASARDDVLGAVGDLHEDLTLVLKRLAASQRELDDVRETLVAAGDRRDQPAVDTDALVRRLRDELAPPLAEVGDDLSVIVRSMSGTQQELDALRESLAELADAVAALAAPEGEPAEEAYEEAYEEVEVDPGPDVAELVDGLRADIDAGLGAAVSDLRDELDSVRRLVADQPEPLAAADVRAELETLLADVRDDLAILAQQLVAGNEEVSGLRADVLETLTGRDGAPATPGYDVGPVVESLAGEVRADVGALAEEVRGQFDRLRQVLSRARPEPAPVDVTSDVEAVVADLHEDLSVVLGQVVAAQEDLQGLREEVAASQQDLLAAVGAGGGDTDDVRAVLDAVAAARDDVRLLRDEMGAGQYDLLAAVGAGGGVDPDDVRAVLDAVAAAHDDVGVLRDQVAALLEVAPASTPPPPIEVEHLEVAIADLPAIMATELRAELEAVADELRAGLSQLQALAAGGSSQAPSGDVAAVREDLQALVGELQTDLATMFRQIVAGQDEVSQLRLEVASAAPVEDAALAIEGVRSDLTAGIADLRADLEALVNELHDDLATVMSQVVAGHDELGTIRQQLVELAERPGGTDQVAEDLDRLTRDLQALRDRIPGSPAPSPARRRPRGQPRP